MATAEGGTVKEMIEEGETEIVIVIVIVEGAIVKEMIEEGETEIVIVIVEGAMIGEESVVVVGIEGDIADK